MLTQMSLFVLASDQSVAWSDEYPERTRHRPAKAPQCPCAATASAQVDSEGLSHRAIQAMRQAGLQMRRRARTRAQILPVGKLSGSATANGLHTPGCIWTNSGVSRQLSPKPRDSGVNLRDQPRIAAPSRGALKRFNERVPACPSRSDRREIGRRASRQYARRLARRQPAQFLFCGGRR